MNTNFTMNAIACKQAKDIFDHMLMTDMPGQNWDCVLIDDMGNGRNPHRVTPGIETRCVCFKKAGEKNLIMRTSKDNPLKFGMLIYIGKQEKFYLLKDHPTPQIDCIAVVPMLCTHMIKFYVKLPDKVNDDGMLVEEGVYADVTGNIPCVVTRKTTSYVTGTNAPAFSMMKSWRSPYSSMKRWRFTRKTCSTLTASNTRSLILTRMAQLKTAASSI